MTDRSAAAMPQGPTVVDPLIGRVINDRFRITDVLARGGMGKIYRAEQAPLGRVCALKVLSPSSGAGEHDGEFHKRFFLEASIASKLTHPNTVTIFDYGRTEDDIYYMAMEYLEGATLQRAIRAAGAFPEERATHIARQICRALREAHSLGVIHRDLKPANIFLVEHGDEADFVKVLDFGLVKNVAQAAGEELTRVGVFVGSPKYMAPEQIRGDKVDARTDIYALGTILFEMLAGKVPFARESTVHIMVAQVNEPPPPIRSMNPNVQVSPALEEAIMRCLAKDPEQRFRSMDEVLVCLKRFTGNPYASATGDHRMVLGPDFAQSLSSSGSSSSLTQMPRDGTGSGPTPGISSISPSGSRPSAPRPSLASSSGSTSGLGGVPSSAAPTVAPPAGPPNSAGDSVPISVPITQPPRFGPSKSGLYAALGAIGLAVLAVLFVIMRPAKEPDPIAAPETPVAVAPPAPIAPAATPSAAPTEAPASVTVRINTDPDGADVRENGTLLCASTPCDVPYEGAEGDPAREHKLTVTRAGYRTEVRSIRVGDSPVVIRMNKMLDASH
jgi:serine/threonine protein kinase